MTYLISARVTALSVAQTCDGDNCQMACGLLEYWKLERGRSRPSVLLDRSLSKYKIELGVLHIGRLHKGVQNGIDAVHAKEEEEVVKISRTIFGRHV